MHKLNTKVLLQKLSKYTTLIFLVFFSLLVAVYSPQFLTMTNILNILRQTSINAIIAAGMTFVILSGGIDLSVGSILAFTGAIMAQGLLSGFNGIISLIAALLIGMMLGMLNGVIICKGKVQPFIATLGTMILLRGATLVFTDGKPISFGANSSNLINALGNGYIFNIPVPVYIMLLVFICGYFILKHMRTGRYVYAIGCNEKASLLAGININAVKIYTYVVCGFLSAMAGVIVTSRLSSAQPTTGSGYELDAIAAVVIGGTSLSGGRGTIIGTFIGALIISVLNNSLNILNISSYYQMVIKGIVIILAVIFDRNK
jgi:ribose transport system permease protein